MNVRVSFVAGLVFRFGLWPSGLANLAKVLGFLDLVGAYALARRRATTWLGSPMLLRAEEPIGRRLTVGSLLLGVARGLAGMWLRPALVLIGTGAPKGFLFAGALIAGMGVFEWIKGASARQRNVR